MQCKNEVVESHELTPITLIKLNASDNNNSKKLSELFNIHKYIPLETNEDCLIGEVTKLIVDDSCIWILDDISKSIFCFDIEGKFKYKINTIGKGPGEYIGITDFSYKNDRLIIFESGRKLIEYNKNGEFVSEKSIDLSATEFNIVDSLNSAFFCNFSYNTDYNLLIVDNNSFETKKRYLNSSYLEGVTNIVVKLYNSSVYQNTLSFWEHYNDTIYQFEDGKLSHRFAINYSNNNPAVAKKILKMANGENVNGSIVYKYEMENNYCNLMTAQETNKGIFFIYQQNNFFHYVFYDKQSGKILDLSKEMSDESPSTPIENDMDGGFYYYFPFADEKYLYGYVNPYELLFSSKNNNALDIVRSKLDENDNPVIVLFEIKDII